MDVRLSFVVLATAVGLTSAAQALGQPRQAGACRWVHGRFAVYNGSGVQRIWIIGTRRIVAIPDDDPAPLPETLKAFEKVRTVDGELIADFHVCALEPRRPGHMQHVRVDGVRSARYEGRPFPPGG
jgi:hypothetical protein